MLLPLELELVVLDLFQQGEDARLAFSGAPGFNHGRTVSKLLEKTLVPVSHVIRNFLNFGFIGFDVLIFLKKAFLTIRLFVLQTALQILLLQIRPLPSWHLWAASACWGGPKCSESCAVHLWRADGPVQQSGCCPRAPVGSSSPGRCWEICRQVINCQFVAVKASDE